MYTVSEKSLPSLFAACLSQVVHFLFLFLFAVKKFSHLTRQKNFYIYFRNCLKLRINIIPFPQIVQYVYTALIPFSYSTRDLLWISITFKFLPRKETLLKKFSLTVTKAGALNLLFLCHGSLWESGEAYGIPLRKMHCQLSVTHFRRKKKLLHTIKSILISHFLGHNNLRY